MNVEGGISAGASAGSAISVGASAGIEGVGAAPVSGPASFDVGSAFGAAPSIDLSGGLLGRGLEFGRPLGLQDISPIVNEGPVKGFRREEFMPTITFNQVNEPDKPEQTLVPEVFHAGLADSNLDPNIKPLETSSKLAFLVEDNLPGLQPQFFRPSWGVFIPQLKPELGTLLPPDTAWSVLPAEEDNLAVQAGFKPEPKKAVVYQAAPLTEPKIEQEAAAFEEIRQLKPQEEQKLVDEEQIEKEFYLKDEQVSEQRRFEIRQALFKAKSEVVRLGVKLTGKLVRKFLPAEHPGNRSQIVKKTGPDGSLQETVETIEAVGELTEEQAVTRFNQIVDENEPVRKGKAGKRVRIGAVIKVLKYRVVKAAAYEVMVKRVIKKGKQGSLVHKPEQAAKPEPTIADFPKLAEVF